MVTDRRLYYCTLQPRNARCDTICTACSGLRAPALRPRSWTLLLFLHRRVPYCILDHSPIPGVLVQCDASYMHSQYCVPTTTGRANSSSRSLTAVATHCFLLFSISRPSTVGRPSVQPMTNTSAVSRQPRTPLKPKLADATYRLARRCIEKQKLYE
ncbi:hypothetical protein OBBRIDRAFT_593156 [Obba rivulosa]|uniref:Uncharacterized protein n=1 Tax=Obba rivulosa TaxID=1052685 RepID=A0A8E2DNN1_9APHY|nr:hypothetical protein OBBRIDRAFT_593156 [Obba rivulosa]